MLTLLRFSGKLKERTTWGAFTGALFCGMFSQSSTKGQNVFDVHLMSPSGWHVYETDCVVDFGWPNLSTVQQTLGTICRCEKNESILDKGSLWSAFLDNWKKAQLLARMHDWDGLFSNDPVVFWVPNREGFEYGFVIKTGSNGVAFIISPLPLRWLSDEGFNYFYYPNEDNKPLGSLQEERLSDWYARHEISRSTAYALIREVGVSLFKKKIPECSHWVSFLDGDQLQIMEDAVTEFKRDARIPADLKEKNRSKVGPKLRMDIMTRDQYTCQICGIGRSDGAILEVDHIHPASKGGTNDPSNLQVLCRDCNAGKSNQILSMP